MARKRTRRTIGVWVLAFAGSTNGVGLSQVTGPASLGYRLTLLGKDAYGIAVLQAGDVFSIKTAGILGVLPTQHSVCPATYRGGVLNKPGGMCVAVERQFSAYFQPGLIVFITKLDVNLKKGKIDVSITACDACNRTEPPSYYRSEVDFQFEKGYLETAKPEAVKATIAQVLAPDPGSEAPPTAAGGMPPGPPSPSPAEKPLPQIAPPPPPPPEPATISLGQTTEEVVASLGKPEKIVNLPPKQVYYYKDMKVIFVNNKVTDIQ